MNLLRIAVVAECFYWQRKCEQRHSKVRLFQMGKHHGSIGAVAILGLLDGKCLTSEGTPCVFACIGGHLLDARQKVRVGKM